MCFADWYYSSLHVLGFTVQSLTPFKAVFTFNCQSRKVSLNLTLRHVPTSILLGANHWSNLQFKVVWWGYLKPTEVAIIIVYHLVSLFEALSHWNAQVKGVLNGSFNINCPLNCYISIYINQVKLFSFHTLCRGGTLLCFPGCINMAACSYLCVILLQMNETCSAPSLCPCLLSHWSEIRLSGWCSCSVMSHFTAALYLRLLCAVSCPN